MLHNTNKETISDTLRYHHFPKTKHVCLVENNSFIDKNSVMSDKNAGAFLFNKLVIEEKVDGAHTAVYFNSSRGMCTHIRNSVTNTRNCHIYKHFHQFISPLEEKLFNVLEYRYILYGEWCKYKFGVLYNKLPGPFLGFDIFDRDHKGFLSYERRNRILGKLGIPVVPEITIGSYCKTNLISMLRKSRFGDMDAEGIYLRWENGFSVLNRGKIINPKYLGTRDSKNHGVLNIM